MSRNVLMRLLIVCILGIPGLFQAIPAVAAVEQCFTETGQCIAGRLLTYWQEHGGLARNGYPLTPERREVLEDGKEYTVQYFERVRMELHPENQPPYDVLLGQFGREVFRETFSFNIAFYEAAARPVASKPGLTYFPETGHNVAPDFYAYWQANGGLAQFGYPLAEEQDRPDSASSPLRVQYFERGRIEEHTENVPPYNILLGQFGRQILGWRDAPLAAPFAALYRGDAALREHVGPPTSQIGSGPLDVLPFERGLILIADAGVTNSGYISLTLLCDGKTPVSPRTFLPGGSFIVTPEEQRPAGGPGPRPGTFEPGGIIGLLWARGLRDCLGYATTATPSRETIINQLFGRGFMLALPARGEAYALYVRAEGDLGTNGYYLRYSLPK